MSSRSTHTLPAIAIPDCQAVEITVGQLFAQVYSAASPEDQRRLLEQLDLLLAGIAVPAAATGNIDKIDVPGGGPVLDLRRARSNSVDAEAVAHLFDRAYQRRVANFAGLFQVLTVSPFLAGTAAATLLAAVLARDLAGVMTPAEVSAAVPGIYAVKQQRR